MTDLAAKYGLGSAGGIHFKDPWLFNPSTQTAAAITAVNNAASVVTSDTTAFFTEMAARGLQDTTNWTADTYKTILNVTSGKGLVAGYVGCTAGGAETHTVEFTIDGGAPVTIAIVNASGQRACLSVGGLTPLAFTTASRHSANVYGALQASNTTFGTAGTNVSELMHWGWFAIMGTPLLRFNTSLLIRAKHSASITNSTATAYSGLMYRLGL